MYAYREHHRSLCIHISYAYKLTLAFGSEAPKLHILPGNPISISITGGGNNSSCAHFSSSYNVKIHKLGMLAWSEGLK